MPNKDIRIPTYLDIATEAAMRINDPDEWNTNEVLVTAIADLESFVRNNPIDIPIIDAGPLQNTPITKVVVNGFEKTLQAEGNNAGYGTIALAQLGIVVGALKTLEEQVQQLTRRVAELEKR